MPWYLWLLLACGFLYAADQLTAKASSRRAFDATSFEYQPSAKVIGLLHEGTKVEAISAIRAETGLDLKDGRDLCEFLIQKHA